jgi:hypothetical protein
VSALTDPTSVVFELVDETPGSGLSLDEAYAFLAGADTSVFGVPKITIAASDHWKDQTRAPRGTEDGGQWVDDSSSAAAEIAKKVEVGSTSADRGNYFFEPKADVVTAVRALIGDNVDVTIDFAGQEFTTTGKLTDVGTTTHNYQGVKIINDTGEKFVPWGMITTLEKNTDTAVRDEANGESPWHEAFADRARSAVTGRDALNATSYISEDAPLTQHWALGAYEADGYIPINSGLRGGNLNGTVEQNRGDEGGGITQTSVEENVKQLDRLFKRHRTTRDIVVHRGIRSLDSFNTDLDVSLEGLEWSDPAYFSTSADKSRARVFSADGGALLRIFVPRGTKALNLGYGESEILLARDQRFRVVSDNGVVDGVRQLDVEVISQ